MRWQGGSWPPSPTAPRAGTLLPHSKLSKEKTSWWGWVFFSLFIFFFFLIAKREGWFQNQSVKADSWGGTFQIPSPPSMLDGIIIKPGLKGGKGAKEPQMTPSE